MHRAPRRRHGALARTHRRRERRVALRDPAGAMDHGLARGRGLRRRLPAERTKTSSHGVLDGDGPRCLTRGGTGRVLRAAPLPGAPGGRRADDGGSDGNGARTPASGAIATVVRTPAVRGPLRLRNGGRHPADAQRQAGAGDGGPMIAALVRRATRGHPLPTPWQLPVKPTDGLRSASGGPVRTEHPPAPGLLHRTDRLRTLKTVVRAMTVVLAIGALRDCAPAQEVREMAWGFDGVHVAPGFFNPLTVVVHNPGNAPFDDVLLLIESNGLTDVGAPIVERCYLAPGATRVVQFHPFVSDIDGSWWLRWASARFARNAVRPAPSVAWRGLVVLHEGQTMREPVNEMPTFPAAWFPAVPGAAEALAHVVLDFAPEWDDARAGAFLAWLRAGNTVHLVPRDGRPPTFGAGPLALLDDPRPHFAVGAGRAVRHDRPLGALKPGDLERPPLPPKEIQPPAQARAPDVLRTLQLALLPDHPWELIFLAAFAYVGCVGPVHWLLARRRIDWRLSIAYLLAIVAAF